MNDTTPLSETIILLDSQKLFDRAVRAVKSEEPSLRNRLKRGFGQTEDLTSAAAGGIREISAEGTSFTISRRFAMGSRAVNFLLLRPENAHLFAWLVLAQRAEQVAVDQVLCVAQAISITDNLHPGDVALVAEAAALPYPALYESRPPAWQPDSVEDETKHRAEIYAAPDASISAARVLVQQIQPHLTQREVPSVRTAYTKHPAWGGSLMPWARQQFEQLAAEGIDTISETPTGVYDFARRYPEITVIGFNVIVGSHHDIVQSQTQAEGESSSPYALSNLPQADAQSAIELILKVFGKEQHCIVKNVDK